MKVIAIKKGGRVRELKAAVTERYMGVSSGELFIGTETGDGTYRPLRVGEDGPLFFCKAVGGRIDRARSETSAPDRDNSLSEEYQYALVNDEGVVLMDSPSTVERALGKLGVKPEKLVVPLFQLLGEMDEVFVMYHLKGWVEANPGVTRLARRTTKRRRRASPSSPQHGL